MSLKTVVPTAILFLSNMIPFVSARSSLLRISVDENRLDLSTYDRASKSADAFRALLEKESQPDVMSEFYERWGDGSMSMSMSISMSMPLHVTDFPSTASHTYEPPSLVLPSDYPSYVPSDMPSYVPSDMPSAAPTTKAIYTVKSGTVIALAFPTASPSSEFIAPKAQQAEKSGNETESKSGPSAVGITFIVLAVACIMLMIFVAVRRNISKMKAADCRSIISSGEPVESQVVA